MSQPSSIKFDITLSPDVVREYFEGKAKVEAAKNKSSIDWQSLMQSLVSVATMYANTQECCAPTVKPEVKKDSTVKVMGQEFSIKDLLGKDIATLCETDEAKKKIVNDIAGMVSVYVGSPASQKEDSGEEKKGDGLAGELSKIIKELASHKSEIPLSKDELGKMVKIDFKDCSKDLVDTFKQLHSIFGLISESCSDSECKKEETKVEENKVEEPKVEEPKVEEHKVETPEPETKVLEEMTTDKMSDLNKMFDIAQSMTENKKLEELEPKDLEEITTNKAPDMSNLFNIAQSMAGNIKLDDMQPGEDMSKVMEKALGSVKDQLKNVEGGDQMTEQISKLMGENGGLADMMKMMGPMMENMMKGMGQMGQIQQPKKKPSYDDETTEDEDTVN